MRFFLANSIFSNTNKVDASAFGIIYGSVEYIVFISLIWCHINYLLQVNIKIKRIIFWSNYLFANAIIKWQVYAPFFRK